MVELWAMAGWAATPQGKLLPGDNLLADYFQAQTAQLSGHVLGGMQSLDQWTSCRKKKREDLFEMLGLSPLPARSDLKPVVTGKLETELFTVEKLHFQSSPGLYVTANLYIPKHLTKPAPTILYVSGHGPVIKNGISYGNKVAYQHHGAWFARNGYVCLILDTLQLGEIQGLHHGTYREGMWWWNSRGYTPAGVEAWNSIRALDYLSTRPEVDTNRFGVTGRSGGGAYSWWLAALDDRIKAAAPVAGITDLQNHVVDGTVEGHCDCMFIVNTYRWDYPQVAALVAPRPLLICNSDSDSIFPLDGVVRLHNEVRKVYQLFGAATNLGLIISQGPHKDTQELQVPVFRFFNHHLKGQDAPVEMAATNFFEPEQLKVFATLPADGINTNVQRTFVHVAKTPSAPASTNAWERQRDAWLSWLNQKTFRAWPREEVPLELKPQFSATHNGLHLEAYDFTSQEKVRLRLYLLERASGGQPETVQLQVLGPHSDSSHQEGPSACLDWQQCMNVLGVSFPKELAQERELSLSGAVPSAKDLAAQLCELKKAVQTTNRTLFAFVAPRGIGLTAWSSDPKKQVQIRRRFMLLGETVDSMRVWDIRRAIQAVHVLKGLDKTPVCLHAQGWLAADTLYASLFEQKIPCLDLWNLPNSHAEGPDYLNVLRILDLPQAAAIAAENSAVHLHQPGSGSWEYPIEVVQRLHWNQKQFVVQ